MSLDWRDDLADRIAARPILRQPLVVGLCGPQGSGKSTAVSMIQLRLEKLGITSAVLSIDDIYLTRAERQALAAAVHPLFATRGPPGTHDVPLGLMILDALARPGETRLPRFDKGADDRCPPERWPVMSSPVDVVLLEGWCVGARPQPAKDLQEPVNALEAEADPEGVWRRAVNAALAGPYQALFDRIDYLAQIRAPSFGQVLTWRIQQERQLQAAGSRGPGAMSDDQIAVFVQHYQRLTEWIALEMPARADLVIDLDADRHLVALAFR